MNNSGSNDIGTQRRRQGGEGAPSIVSGLSRGDNRRSRGRGRIGRGREDQSDRADDGVNPYDVASTGTRNWQGRGRGGDSSRGRRSGDRRGSSRGRGSGDSSRGRGSGDSTRGRGSGDSTRGRGSGSRGRGGPRFMHFHRMEFSHLMELAKCRPSEVVIKIKDDLKGFQQSLNSCSAVPEKAKERYIIAIINLLLKICQARDDSPGEATTILAEFLSDRCAGFHLLLKQYVSDTLPLQVNVNMFMLNQLCQLFKHLLDTLPSSAWAPLPINDFYETVRVLTNDEEICRTVVELKAQRDEARREHMEKKKKALASNREWDNSLYRTLPITPTMDEICSSDSPPLRSNIVEGAYTDWEHYYDIQFRLLREDFLAPLRRGISVYRSQERTGRLTDINVYNNVFLIKPEFTENGVCYQVQFDVSRFKQRKSWAHSKRLIFGSLLCFSPKRDQFQESVYFATVVERKPEDLVKGVFYVQFENSHEMFQHILSTCFVVIESRAYFEASRHILRSLQAAETDTMPFKRYLIDNNPTPVSMPVYLQNGETYDIRWLYPESKRKKNIYRQLYWFHVPIQRSCGMDIDIMDESAWPTEYELELDESQIKAIRMALTQEISVIQGPPGTGKTYIGYKIVQTLLQNRLVWDPHKSSPILVMCYTNHALDQFLQGIIHHTTSLSNDDDEEETLSIVRIGGRSKSEKIQEHSLWNARGKTVPPRMLFEARDQKEQIIDIASMIPFENLQGIIRNPVNEHIIGREGMKRLRLVIKPHHYYQLTLRGQEVNDEGLSLEIWLGLWVSSTSPVPSQDHNESDASKTAGDGENYSDELTSHSMPNDEDESEVSFEDELIEVTGEAEIEESSRHVEGSGYQRLKLREKTDFPDDALARHIEQQSNNDNQSQDLVKKDDIEIKKTLQVIRSIEPFELEDEEEIFDISALSLRDRYRLFRLWIIKYQQSLSDDSERNLALLEQECLNYKLTQQNLDRIALEKAAVIGMTTTGAAKYQHILHMIKPKIVIVEEAAEVLESHIVSALNAGTQHLILIGDHKQLRPKPNEYDLAKKHKLEVSLFERLLLNGLPHATLLIQHRMRPQISSLVRPSIYEKLIDHDSVQIYENIKSCDTNMFFFNHCHPEKEIEHLLSHSNIGEAKLVVSLCRHLLKQGYNPSQITILTAYTGQLLCVRDMMPKAHFEGVQVVNVDNFQGEENDIIILSLVRNNDAQRVGFLREENRVCVALSRARMGFYCFGNFDMLRNVVPIWELILQYVEKQNCLGFTFPVHCHNHPDYKINIEKAEDFEIYFPEGGCVTSCKYHLECGHQCKSHCHITDPDHQLYICKERCDKPCPRNLHYCPLLCSDACRPCAYFEPHVMPQCGHLQEIVCYKDPSDELCYNPCDKKCPNGHKCLKKCHENCGNCLVLLDKIIPKCKHVISVYCYIDPSKAVCYEKCQKIYDGCDHRCPKLCYQQCDISCQKPVQKVLPCSHVDDIPCSQDPVFFKCTQPCKQTRKCRHPCKRECGQICSDYDCEELVKFTLSCGHETIVKCCDILERNKSLRNSEKYKCQEKCTKQLPCGHPCKETCESPCTAKCTQKVSYTCHKGYHTYKLRCFEAENDPQCNKLCIKKLACGHPCTNKCDEECSKICSMEVKRECPCGHKHEFKCTEHGACTCKKNCPVILQCGHKCPGKCGECYNNRIHSPCVHQVQVNRFCGHFGSVPCLGLSDQCKESCRLSICPHRRDPCQHKCYEPCTVTQCVEECVVECLHRKCTDVCSKICANPSCTKPCTKLLEKCHHECPGICGDKCIDKCCPRCDGKKFSEKVKGLKKKAILTAEKYLKLDCGHIYAMKYLDQRFAPKESQDSLICPLLCPACSKPFISPHYWKMSRERAKDMAQVKKQLLFADYQDKSPTLHHRAERHRKHIVSIDTENICALLLLSKAFELQSRFPKYCFTLPNVFEGMLYRGTKYKLSTQIISDVESEFFRISLLALTEETSSEESSMKQPVHSLLQKMDDDHNLRLTYEMYEEYLPAIRRSSVYEVIPVSIPRITKGEWYKCSRAGHIYFAPAQYRGKDNRPKCTKCSSN